MTTTKILNTALCSFGMSGKVFHAPFIHCNPNYSLYAVWERTKQLATLQYPNIKSYKNYTDLLADDVIDLVIVNTPNICHFEHTKAALEAGKHVVVEKPFTVTVAEADELIALAKKNNLMLDVYHNRRYDSDYKVVKKIVQEKLLGDIVEVEIHYDRFRQELSPKQHKENPQPGAGVLYDLGAHLIDQALQLFGMPKAIFADIVSMRPQSRVDDYFELLFYYPKHRVRLKASYQVMEALPAYILHGSTGSFIKNKTDVQETALQNGQLPNIPNWGVEPDAEKGLLSTINNGQITKKYIAAENGNYMQFYDDLYKTITENKPTPVGTKAARDVIAIIEAAFESSRSGRIIEI
jgi:scyllo-inositol 2-dehydrogenase (NADP+)